MSLKDRIQELVNAGYSKTKLAIAAGVSPGAVTHWINGATKEIKGPSASGLQQLTGFSAAYLIDGTLPKMAVEQLPGEPATPMAMSLAFLFDKLPHNDIVMRTKAYTEASAAILRILEDHEAKTSEDRRS